VTMKNRALLAAFAHPDDEAFGTGGTLAHYAAQGVQVNLVCATRGEVGEISDASLATAENLGEVREQELRCSGRALGAHEVIFLGYRDSGMAGTPDNADPRAFANALPEDVVARLVAVIRRLKPEVVITFEPGGGYGHPDHMAISRHTLAAFQAAADPNAFPNQGPAWAASRLFYSAIPRSFFREMRDRLEAMGVDTSQFGRFDENSMGWPDEKVHCTIDVSDRIEAKWAALQCHRTQFGPDNLFRRLPEEVLKQLMSREHFSLVVPEDASGLCRGDLFSGLDQTS
jgi:N-acetyl-1-D-myo-inositol-2-amino-2-deoxy-alpha-D-glucopyranoside deacetylase